MTTIARFLVGISMFGFLGKTEERCVNLGWEKIGGVKPESVGSQTTLYSAVSSRGITKPCFERCERVNCTSFVVDFRRSVCYIVATLDDELVPDASSTFYHRVCVEVPATCAERRFWQVERNPGAMFIDSSAFHLRDTITREECYEKCIETGRSCKSAQFRTTRPLSSDNAYGRCTLSLHERGTRPRAYIASMYRDEYLADQCRNLSRRQYCSYAEYRNASLPYSDVALPNLNEKQCERRCDLSVDGFICRAYTLDNSTGEPTCLLHSEDTISLGVSSLIDMRRTVYREREPCLDLKVRCNDSAMTVELRTPERFFGRIYSSGYAEKCGAQGTGSDRTVLTLPIPSADHIREGRLPCGLNPAFAVDDRNGTRPLVWATIVIQFNPIVQRLGDQAVKVGCSLSDREPPQPRNVTVHSSFSFLDANAGIPAISWTVVNVSSQAPMVTMRILDENSNDAIVTQVGQKLTLRIQLSPADGPYDIMAGHLVASSASGDSSYLLLDELGCPTDPSAFPALMKDPADGRSLVAPFAAFKFANSQLVRFDVLVRFCVDRCIPTNCSDDRVSYGRRRRAADHLNDDESDENTSEELTLRLSIIVQNPVSSSADRLSSGENCPDTVLLTNGYVKGTLCIDASLALSLLIFWLIIQIALIVGCLLVVARYRRTAVKAEEDRARVIARHLYGIHGGNFEIARRVRWADHSSSSHS